MSDININSSSLESQGIVIGDDNKQNIEVTQQSSGVGERLVQFLADFSSQVEHMDEIASEKRDEILEQLAFLCTQIEKKPEHRSKAAVLKPIVETIGAAVSSLEGLSSRWATWLPRVRQALLP